MYTVCVWTGVLYAVNGPDLYSQQVKVEGFTLDPDSGEVLQSWASSPTVCSLLILTGHLSLVNSHSSTFHELYLMFDFTNLSQIWCSYLRRHIEMGLINIHLDLPSNMATK